MLKSLEIHNYALLDNVSVEFGNGLIILTGETGAGKSIFIDALGAILGEKVTSGVIRQGAPKAIVEAVFSTESSGEVQHILKAREIWDDSGDLILRREVLPSGRTRCFANDTPINQQALVELGDLLVDLHGQHQHQSLLKVNEHIRLLDQFGGLGDAVNEISELYQELREIQKAMETLRSNDARFAERHEILKFQLREITDVAPEPGEEELLLKEEKVLQNSEKLFQTASRIYQDLYEDDGSAYERLSGAVEALSEVRQIDERLSPMTVDCKSAAIAIEETAKFLQDYISGFEFNPERLEEIRQRLAQFSHLKKKYGATMAAVFEHQQKIQDELAGIGNAASDMKALQSKFDNQQKVFSEKCLSLSARRKEAAARLQAFLEASLAELGMSEAAFNIQLKQQPSTEGVALIAGERLKATRNGIDKVEFLLSANPGSSPRPLVEVASGGEISRVMLALKLAQADADRLPVMIFDEIDTGVSGRIAQAVGRNMRRLSNQHQILCITHLPQIASMGHHHFLVEKFVDNGSTRTVVRKLSSNERIQAVATLLGGEVISPALLNSARELIEEAENGHDIC